VRSRQRKKNHQEVLEDEIAEQTAVINQLRRSKEQLEK